MESTAQPRKIIVVAQGQGREIGAQGSLLWHLSGDLKRFKNLTMGFPVIMGRATWESLPRRPLPGRLNIVVSRNPLYQCPGARLASSVGEALEIAASSAADRLFIIGGGALYREMFPLADAIDLTQIYASFPEADTFFPEIDPNQWRVESSSEPLFDEKSGLNYRHFFLSRKPS